MCVQWRKRSDFFRNTIITFSGTFLASVVSFLLTPVVSRIYDPDDFGSLALLTTMAANLGLIAGLSYSSALVLPRSRSTFYHLAQLYLGLTVLGAVGVLLFLLAGYRWVLELLNVPSLGAIVFLVPLFMMLEGVGQLATGWNVRRQQFKENALSNISYSLSMRATNITYGFFQADIWGLLWGNIGAGIIRNYLLLRKRGKEVLIVLRRFRLPEIKKAALTYKNYPLWTTPAGLINAISASLPIYVFAIYFDTTLVGFFSFSQALLNQPYVMLSGSVTPVFLQHANNLYQEDFGKLQDLVLRLYRRLLLFGGTIFGGLIFFSKWLIPFVFGQKWETAGVFAGYISIFFLFRIISVPLVPVFRILGKEQFDFVGSGSILLLRGLALLIGIYFFDPVTTILLFSIAGTIPCLVNTLLVFHVLQLSLKTPLLQTMIYLGGILVAFWGVRILLEWILL